MAPVYCLEDLLKFSEGIISNLYSKLAPYLPHPLTHFLHIIWFPDSCCGKGSCPSSYLCPPVHSHCLRNIVLITDLSRIHLASLLDSFSQHAKILSSHLKNLLNPVPSNSYLPKSLFFDS